MLEDGKISTRQFAIIVMFFTIGGAILVMPSILAIHAKQDVWIAAILGVILSLGLIWLYSTLGSLFPNMTLVEYSEEILGKWIGKIVSLLYISYFFILAAILLREIGDFMTTQIMPETPIYAIHFLFLIVVMAGIRVGLEPLTRAAEIFLPWIIMLFLMLVLFLLPQVKFENVQPVLEQGIKPILAAVYPFMGLPFMELIILLMIFPYINQKKGAKKAYLLGTLLGGILLICVVLMSILVIGVDQSERQMYASYILAKKINIAGFFQRIEVIVAGFWMLTIYFKLTICFYATALGFSQVFQLREYRFLTYPLGLFLLPLSLIISKNIVYFQMFAMNIWATYSLTFGLFFPILMLGIAVIRKKRGRENIKANEVKV